MDNTPAVVEETSQKKGKPKGFVKPNPGKHAVTQKVVMEPVPGKDGGFSHDESVPLRASQILSRKFYAFEERFNTQPMGEDEYDDLFLRLFSMLLAKKLATALSDDQITEFGPSLGKISKLQINAPSGLVQLADLFGCVEHEKTRFSMYGQPVLAFTYFCRGCLNNPNVHGGVRRRDELLYVNTYWRNWHRQMIDYTRSVVNAWAVKAVRAEFNFGPGLNVLMTIPQFEVGAAAFAAFIQAVPNVPPLVVRMLGICALCEAVNPAVQLTADAVQAFSAVGVEVVSWNSQDLNENSVEYNTRVESRLRNSLSAKTNWVLITAMKNRGSPGQLLTKRTEDMFYAPLCFSSETMDIGWLIAGVNNFVRTNEEGARLLPPVTTAQGISLFGEGMMRN
jgi:hypothetical protein